MEAMLIVFGASILAFLAALFSLLRVRGTCAGSCERLGRLACEGCPRLTERRERGEPRSPEKESTDASAW